LSIRALAGYSNRKHIERHQAMSIENRLVEDQDFYVRVQKTKLVFCIVAAVAFAAARWIA